MILKSRLPWGEEPAFLILLLYCGQEHRLVKFLTGAQDGVVILAVAAAYSISLIGDSLVGV